MLVCLFQQRICSRSFWLLFVIVFNSDFDR